jgi:hypothetical protein
MCRPMVWHITATTVICMGCRFGIGRAGDRTGLTSKRTAVLSFLFHLSFFRQLTNAAALAV